MAKAMRNCMAVFLSVMLCFPFASFPAFADEPADEGAPASTETPALEEPSASDEAPALEEVSVSDEAPALEEAVSVSDAVTYVYVDAESADSADGQSVVVGVSDAFADAEDVQLVYSAVDGEEPVSVPVSNAVSGAFLFSVPADDALTCRLEGLAFLHGGTRCFASFAADGAGDEVTLGTASPEAAEGDGQQGEVSAYSVDENGETVVARASDVAAGSRAADSELQNEEAVASVLSAVSAATAGSDAASLAADADSRSADARSVASKITVALDPGHGGYDPGAGANGLEEADLTWAIANACKTALESYGRYKVVLTRSENECPGLRERVHRARDAGASLIVSIHINSAEAASASGCEVWIPNDHGYLNAQTHGVAEDVASSILDQLSALGLKDRGLKIKDSDDGEAYEDGSLSDYFTVINEARRCGLPAMIVEHAFITNRDDASKLADPVFLRKLGQADARGIADTFYFAHSKLELSSDFYAGSRLGMSVTGTQGETDGLTYNFAYKTVGDWSNWDSTAKATGSYTSDDSYEFTLPSEPGEYVAWANVKGPDGIEQQTPDVRFTVKKGSYSWGASTTVAPSTAYVGDTVEFSTDASGADVSSLIYNFVWRQGTSWDGDWGSTVKDTGSTTKTPKGSFVPGAPGTYQVWVDVSDPQGRTVTTKSCTIEVAEKQWSVGGTVVEGAAKVGAPLAFSAEMTGASSSGLTFNYVWRQGTSWDGEWGSTIGSTGSYTTETSGVFTPSEPGTYQLWVDVMDDSGKKMTTKGATVEVTDWDWSAGGTVAPSTSPVGHPVEFSAAVSGADSALLRYNYVWRQGTSWDGDWGSTLQDTGSYTAETSGSFTPSEPGLYQVWVDVVDAAGNKVSTSGALIEVVLADWTEAVTVAPSSARVGDKVSFSTSIPASQASGMRFNYVWRYGDTWDLWGSTVKSTGSPTTASSSTFVPQKSGMYEVWVDATDSTGRTVTLPSVTITVAGESIMGQSQTTMAQMVRAYKRSGHAYPSSVYASLGAPTIDDFCRILSEEANAEGVRSEVLFAQVMHETGWLSFGGDVRPEQCNFGGLGAVGGGASGATFPDVRTGLRAQTQHLKAYGSVEPLVNECVDPRFGYVARGCAPTVDGLAGRWAGDPDYGIKLTRAIDSLLNS